MTSQQQGPLGRKEASVSTDMNSIYHLHRKERHFTAINKVLPEVLLHLLPHARVRNSARVECIAGNALWMVLCLYQISLDKLCQVHGVSYTSPFTGMDEFSDSEHEVSALP